jgi:hypothetical protein
MLNRCVLDLLAGNVKIRKSLKLGYNALMIRVLSRTRQPSGSRKQLSASTVAIEFYHAPPFCC